MPYQLVNFLFLALSFILYYLLTPAAFKLANSLTRGSVDKYANWNEPVHLYEIGNPLLLVYGPRPLGALLWAIFYWLSLGVMMLYKKLYPRGGFSSWMGNPTENKN